ncbi:very short patch repair endonuclease [Kineosporia babensis]|uniref:Very short patch repair endonuclease n=1 Tax=Kineosporia babensis TaxID=499548 RepID=A0A9X1SYB8_9ACTN|nr:very short patch repair endonuclease [Kineosporia babensis]MCD5317052.1 very short patch repair endonuclease [Kineosporia babensis]
MPSPPIPSSLGVTSRMRRQARQDTTPELELRRLLHAKGLRYRVGMKVPGMPRRTIDIAFTAVSVAVFVDGCFWHGCPEHATWPTANSEWWRSKIMRNQARDTETTNHLMANGWFVHRMWEHESFVATADIVFEIVAQRR